MQNEMPNTLPNGRGSLSKAGASPEPGGVRYMDMAGGKPTTVFEALAINTGPRFVLVAVKGNQSLNRVQVEHRSLYGGASVSVGDSLLVGGLVMTEQGPVATMGWLFRAPSRGNGQSVRKPSPLPPRPPRITRHVGTVSRIHPSGKFGEILEDGTGHRYFAHQSQFEKGARMMAGFRVSFTTAKTERGPAALDIKPN